MSRPTTNNLCPKCKTHQRDGRQPYCASCLATYHKDWRRRHRNSRSQYQRLYRLRKIREQLKETQNPTISELGDQL